MSCPDSPLQSTIRRHTNACAAGCEESYGFFVICPFCQRVISGPLLDYTGYWACFLLGPSLRVNPDDFVESSSNSILNLGTPLEKLSLSTIQGASCSPAVKVVATTDYGRLGTDRDHDHGISSPNCYLRLNNSALVEPTHPQTRASAICEVSAKDSSKDSLSSFDSPSRCQ
jgi:hypothetical protein